MAGVEQKGSLLRLLPFPVSPVVAHDAVPMRIARNYQMAQLMNDRVYQNDAKADLPWIVKFLRKALIKLEKT